MGWNTDATRWVEHHTCSMPFPHHTVLMKYCAASAPCKEQHGTSVCTCCPPTMTLIIFSYPTPSCYHHGFMSNWGLLTPSFYVALPSSACNMSDSRQRLKQVGVGGSAAVTGGPSCFGIACSTPADGANVWDSVLCSYCLSCHQSQCDWFLCPLLELRKPL